MDARNYIIRIFVICIALQDYLGLSRRRAKWARNEA